MIHPLMNQFITGHEPFVTYLHRFGLCSHDRCVCGDIGDPNHIATDCPVTKPFNFIKPSAGNLSMWCENIVQNKRSLTRLMSIMKIFMKEGMISQIKKDISRFHHPLKHSLHTFSVYFMS
ncbi:hypothetical protein AVEN_181627-1 [Araneus ventricosus]|uniref:Uncharacterized protein n=1 Tax=Araneus ventricosus TaxID=182803 RepID=A0A4Y2CLL1_ARAVE|nr:hypothetical protein AVEN_181627-1 [Araneus ventricosus]